MNSPEDKASFIITISDSHVLEKKYILHIFFHDFLNVEYSIDVSETIDGYYVEGKDEKFLLPDIFFKKVFKKDLEKEPEVHEIMYGRSRDEKLPAWFTTEDQASYLLKADIIGMAFFLLSGYADIKYSKRDDLERDIGNSSFVVRKLLIDRPIIQEWFLVLGELLLPKKDFQNLKNRKFSLSVTHDVDQPYEYLAYNSQRFLKRIVGDLLRRRSLQIAITRLQGYINKLRKRYKRDPYNNFQELIELLEKYGVKSSFFFVASDNKHPQDVKYKIEHPAISEILKFVNEKGHKIGIHPSFFTFRNPEKLKEEIQRLSKVLGDLDIDQSVISSRKHYLRWDWLQTPLILSEAGITDDYTVGYPDRTGFRVGVTFPYSAFCWNSKKALPLKIHPLCVMECSLTHKRYMGLTYNEAELKVSEYADLIKKIGGEYVVLWHNHVLINKEELNLFSKVLDTAYTRSDIT
ncbi:MAG: polysaccharide deacetylase family protein [Balneolaceae bacterium]|nr:polysaccharide deacetylase family protein [Balneolaceae bacterium]MBO6546047.1 polysaccharide deacetylase family protein [Balneolaceae bacterium]MBO6647443.1 polysaccharide deacetylase family protein [Balneolaceae bacterium]